MIWRLAPLVVLLLLPMALLALVLHEAAHAWAADRLGDPTARLSGRLTLNPLAHLDPLGTLMILFTGFGWARPVPVDTRQLKRPRRDLFWIASAGPASNLVQALALGTIIRLSGSQGLAPIQAFMYRGILPEGLSEAFFVMVGLGVYVNIILAWFNLLPVPPLDGSRLVLRFLSPQTASAYLRYGHLGLLALVVMFFAAPQLLWVVMGPPVRLTSYLFSGIMFF